MDAGTAAGQPESPRVVGGVAVIPVQGVLLDDYGGSGPAATGYPAIHMQMLTAFMDPNVQGLLFSINSPGGEVSGCFDLVDAIVEAKEQFGKPVAAVVGDIAYSAAYAIASAADSISVSRTGGVGSIGVVALHVDATGALQKAGLQVTVLTSGARKADQSPFQSLSDCARRDLQGELDATRELFAATVARNRRLVGAQITTKSVMDTEARTFSGPDGATLAVRMGLADAVVPPAAAFRAFHSFVHQPDDGEDDESDDGHEAGASWAQAVATVNGARR
jgi:ClpP class serine protease